MDRKSINPKGWKRHILLAAMSVACMAALGCSSPETGNGQRPSGNGDKEQLVISFDFRRGGIASSQYAIWIEDGAGKLVRTLYATSFTAQGGYEYRKDALPLWVEKVQPGQMTTQQVDAITGATPRNGHLTYTWDGTDADGQPVRAGRYRFFVEGTLHWKSRILFSGEVDWGGHAQENVPVETHRLNPDPDNQDMIGSLKASHLKP